jgi:hypothetical protein
MTQGLETLYPGVREGGILPLQNLQGSGVLTFGNVWFVNSATGSDTANNGKNTSNAFATINAAISAATASNGDVVFVMPGHTETITTTTNLVLNKAGINIVGLGFGALRPTLTFTTANTANIPLTAKNITIQNILFVGNFLSIASCFTITGTAVATDFGLFDCEFRDTSAVLGFLSIVTTNSTANAADGLNIMRCRWNSMATTTPGPFLSLLCTNSRVRVAYNYMVREVDTSIAHWIAKAALVSTNLQVDHNILYTRTTDSSTANVGGLLISTTSTTDTGMVHDNYVKGFDTAAEVMVSSTGSKLGEFNNLYDGDADKSGFVSPAIGSTA